MGQAFGKAGTRPPEMSAAWELYHKKEKTHEAALRGSLWTKELTRAREPGEGDLVRRSPTLYYFSGHPCDLAGTSAAGHGLGQVGVVVQLDDFPQVDGLY